MDYLKTFDATIATAAAASEAVDRQGFSGLALETVAKACESAAVSYTLMACSTKDGTFVPVYHQTQSGISGLEVPESCVVALGTISQTIPRYVKAAVNKNTATAAMACKIHCFR
jgi:hypothetical protein